MAPEDPRDLPDDDETEIAVAKGQKKFLESSTHLETAIYDGQMTTRASPVSRRDIATEHVPEHVSRVLAKADRLLAGLRGAADDSDDATIPTEDDDVSAAAAADDSADGESMLADVTELERPPREAPGHAVRQTPRKTPLPPPRPRTMDDQTKMIHRGPPAEGSIDDFADDLADDLVDDLADETVLERPNPLRPSIDPTTQVEALPADFDSVPRDPTLRGASGPLGVPLSDRPIGPGPMASMTSAVEPTAGGAGDAGDADDAIRTLSTDAAPVGMPIPPHMLPRPSLSSPPRRTGLGGFVDSIKRMFGWRGPPAPPLAPDDEESLQGYGAGTYTVANRHVAQRRERDANRNRGSDPSNKF